MIVRNAATGDLDDIMRVYGIARQAMRAGGNLAQWVNGYPQRELVADDIERGECFVMEGDDGLLHAVFMFSLGDDPTYAVIEDGSWLNDERYGVIHRIASDGALRGVVRAAVDFACGRTDNVRIDTHEDNVAMRRALGKIGFAQCGTICCADGTPRLAFHLARGRAGSAAPADTPTGARRGSKAALVADDASRGADCARSSDKT